MSLRISDQHLFHEIQSILNDAGIENWLDQGSLLGIVRSGKLIPGDHDIDLGVWQNQIVPAKQAISDTARQRGIRVKARSPSGMLFHCLHHAECIPVSIAFYTLPSPGIASKVVFRPNTSVGRVRGGLIWMAQLIIGLQDFPQELLDHSRRLHRGIVRCRRFLPAWMIRELAWISGKFMYAIRPQVTMSCDASHFQTLDEISTDDIRIKVPSDVERYLEFKFGSDWRIPKSDWNYWKDDGAVLKESK